MAELRIAEYGIIVYLRICFLHLVNRRNLYVKIFKAGVNVFGLLKKFSFPRDGVNSLSINRFT